MPFAQNSIRISDYPQLAAGGGRASKQGAVALILNYVPRGWGTREEFFCRLGRELIRRGKGVLIITPAEPRAETRRRYEELGIPCEVLNLESVSVHTLEKLRHLKERFRITAAYLRFFCPGQLAAWMVRLCGIRHIIFAAVTSGTVKATKVRLRCLHLWRRFACAPVSRFIAISEFVKNVSITFGVARERITLVYNGIDTETFHPDAAARSAIRRTLDLSEENVVVLAAAYFLPRKRLSLVLDAIAVAKRQNPFLHLLLAGEGPLEAALRA